jgi:hypothetical protein
MYALKLFSILILFSSFICATTYENASNKKTSKWHVLDYFSTGVIKNIYDKTKKSRVIKFKGNGTKSVYILMPKKKIFRRKKGENIFQWEMNYSEDFVIMIGMQTLKGKRYLIYTSGNEDSYLQYGLGRDSTSGKWKKYSRNLQEDLEASDKYNKIISVNSFVIKGSGKIDNIQMLKSKEKETVKNVSVNTLVNALSTDSKPVVEKKTELETNSTETKITANSSKKNNQPPVISLKGKNPMVLKKGERYIEPGATAKNRDGSSVLVTISEDVDVFKDGEYSVIYMATNRAGHSAIDRRRVRVGTVVEEKEEAVVADAFENDNEDAPLEEEEEVVDLEQRALEILDWEKQLAEREEAIEERKIGSENQNLTRDYPSHPGL